MSTALYRRYRPETFADVIGQEHVTEPLMQALRTGRVNHAYLSAVRAAAARRRAPGSWPVASTASRARRRSRAAPATPASRSPGAARAAST